MQSLINYTATFVKYKHSAADPNLPAFCSHQLNETIFIRSVWLLATTFASAFVEFVFML